MASIYNRWVTEEPMAITHDPAKDDNRPWHQVYGERTRKPGLVLQRAYALSRQGRWDRMRSYLVWELSQPVSGDPAMDQVRELHKLVKHTDSIDQLTYRHMASARLCCNAGYTEAAIARLGWLLELIPPTNRLHTQVATMATTFAHISEQP